MNAQPERSERNQTNFEGRSPKNRHENSKNNLRVLCLVITLTAIWLAGMPWLSWYSLGVLATMLLTYLMGCRRTRLAVAAIVPTMILPYAWIFLDPRHSWDEYRRIWAGMLLELPGLISMVVMRLYGDASVYERLVAAVTSAILFLLLVLAGRVNRNWLIATIFLALNLSILNSYIAHGLYAMSLVPEA